MKNKILIEPLMRDNINNLGDEIQVYCFSGSPELIIKIYGNTNKTSLYDKNLNIIDNPFSISDEIVNSSADNNIKLSIDLSRKLSKDFCFVRIDWMIYQNKLWFEEMTFTPFSGFNMSINSKYNKHFGKLIKWENNNDKFFND